MFFFGIMSTTDKAVAITKYESILAGSDDYDDSRKSKAFQYLRALKLDEEDELHNQKLYDSLQKNIATEFRSNKSKFSKYARNFVEGVKFVRNASDIRSCVIKCSENEISVVDKVMIKGFIHQRINPCL